MSGRRRTTLSDVASRAGVSVTTASYILNGRSAEMRISHDAAERVRTAAADLEYRPNRNARSLRTATTATFGVISDHVASGSYSSRMLTGASAAARASDHVLMIGETEGDPEVEIRLIGELLDRQVDGILYATLATSVVQVPKLLRDQHVVLLNCMDPGGQVPAVVPDELEGGRTAAQVLIDAGIDGDNGGAIRVVGYDSDPRAVAGPLRLRGVRERLREAGIPLGEVIPCAWDVVPAFDAVQGLLRSGEPVRALVCLNDRIAMGAYQAISEHGLSVPDDVAVVSFDGSDLAAWLRPTVTSVSIPFADLGAVAVAALMDRTQGVQRLPMPLVVGGSA
jgi:LacI family transcriptional regulator